MEDNINDILVDLEDDYHRKDDLKTQKVELSDKVRKNENKVNSKMKKIKESQLNKEKEEALAERNKILKLDIETLNSKITKLTNPLAAVKKAKLLDDN